jgi:hypothetical protein
VERAEENLDGDGGRRLLELTARQDVHRRTVGTDFEPTIGR